MPDPQPSSPPPSSGLPPVPAAAPPPPVVLSAPAALGRSLKFRIARIVIGIILLTGVKVVKNKMRQAALAKAARLAAAASAVPPSPPKPAPPSAAPAKPAPSPVKPAAEVSAATPANLTEKEAPAEEEEESSEEEDPKARQERILDACANEVGILCHETQSNFNSATKCLMKNEDSLLKPCRLALGLDQPPKEEDSSKPAAP